MIGEKSPACCFVGVGDEYKITVTHAILPILSCMAVPFNGLRCKVLLERSVYREGPTARGPKVFQGTQDGNHCARLGALVNEKFVFVGTPNENNSISDITSIKNIVNS